MDFVIVGNPWEFGRDNPTSKHQVAMMLVSQGHRVLWIDSAGFRRPRVTSAFDWRRVAQKVGSAFQGLREVSGSPAAGRLWVVSPLIIPLPKSRVARQLNTWIYERGSLRAVRRLGLESPPLISFFLMVPDMMRRWRWPSVYYCVDKWSAFERYDSDTMSQMNRQSCEAADLVLASSSDILDDVSRHTQNSHLMSHGVDHAHFARVLRGTASKRPDDLPDGKVAGFFGLIDERVDQELLVRLADTLRAGDLETRNSKLGHVASVALIGKVDVGIGRLRHHPNIYVLGPKPFDELPSYVAHFDVGLIPYCINEQTRAINPIKLREMMAAGTPVVTTDMPEVASLKLQVSSFGRRVSDRISVARGNDEFVAAVNEGLANPLADKEKQELSESVSGETWTNRVERLIELIEQER